MRIVTSVITLSALFFAVPAQATITRLVGGDGGGPSMLQCPDGQVVVGIRASAGDWIDGVYALCASPGGSDRQPTGFAGGRGGETQEFYCPTGSWVESLKATVTVQGSDHDRYVNAIGFTCSGSAPTQCIATGEGCDINPSQRIGERVYAGGPAESVSCPRGEGAIALNVRSGSHLDAIGLVCGAVNAALAVGSGAPTAPGSAGVPTFRPRGSLPVMAPPAGLGARAMGSTSSSSVSPAPATGDACPIGLVWREASPSDHVCVSPAARDRVAGENRMAAGRVDPASAPNCLPGYVWREAFPGDVTCVPPESRDLARSENGGAGMAEKIR